MSNDRFNNSDINSILHGLFRPPSLRELFENKLKELDMSPTAVLGLLDMQHRALTGILDGTQKTVDYTYFIKLASFLQMPREKVIELYMIALESRFPTVTVSPEKIQFIKENFDLAALRKAGFIDSITDFEQIEQRLLVKLGLKSIFEYKRPGNDVAFSSGLIVPKNPLIRSFWIKAAITVFEEIDNPYEYSRQALIEYFPQIRWHSTNVERGLTEVIRSLYKIGITVIYLPPLPTLQLRGATFAIDDKPCIVLTNYVGYYSTLWFALIHELYHVLFDWEDIKTDSYHLTDDDNDQLTVQHREKMANDFAREYLFSKEKTAAVKRYINDNVYINDYAKNNHVHPGLIYVFAAFDAGAGDRRAWGRAKQWDPTANAAIGNIDIPWDDQRSTEEIIKKRKRELYL